MKQLNIENREQRKSWNGKPYRSLDYMSGSVLAKKYIR